MTQRRLPSEWRLFGEAAAAFLTGDLLLDVLGLGVAGGIGVDDEGSKPLLVPFRIGGEVGRESSL